MHTTTRSLHVCRAMMWGPLLTLSLAGCSSGSGPPTTAPNTVQEPIRIVFKIHIEPQGPVAAYQLRRRTVERVRAVAEQRGVPLTLHGNGEFWQHALEQGDRGLVEGWLAAGHDIGTHAHAIHEHPDGSHRWSDLGPNPTPEATREAWRDHHRHLAALLPHFDIRQATPWNVHEPGFLSLMTEFGYTVVGGGRHEIAYAWLGHPPFHPFRLGTRYLEEDLSAPVLMVHHGAQFGEAQPHGPPGMRTFQDHTIGHLQVDFLQIYLAWLHAERSGEPSNRIWLFGFLTHDNATPEPRLTEIASFLDWIRTRFVRTSARGNLIARFSSMSEVAAAYERWEAAHAGVSSSHIPTPRFINPNDATRITDAESRRIYPYPYWGLAQELRANEARVASWLSACTVDDPEVGCDVIEVGSRNEPTARQRRWLLLREGDGEGTLDLTRLTGRHRLRSFHPMTGEVTLVDARSVRVAAEPVLLGY